MKFYVVNELGEELAYAYKLVEIIGTKEHLERTRKLTNLKIVRK